MPSSGSRRSFAIRRLGHDLDIYRNYAIDIFDSGQLLLQLINDILDMAKLESGRVDLEEREIDLPAVMAPEPAPGRAEGGTRGGSQHRRRISHPYLPPLMGGERALKQIVLNLLSNAVKFTPSGRRPPKSWRGSTRHGGIEIVVSDSGIGIPRRRWRNCSSPSIRSMPRCRAAMAGPAWGSPSRKKLVEAA